MTAEQFTAHVNSRQPQSRAPEVALKNLRETIKDKPILIFSGLAILWTALFLTN